MKKLELPEDFKEKYPTLATVLSENPAVINSLKKYFSEA